MSPRLSLNQLTISWNLSLCIQRSPVMRSFMTRCLVLLLTCPLVGCQMASMNQNSTGVQLFQQGRYNEALQYFEAAKQSSPTNPDSYYNLASTYHKLGVVNKDTKLTDQAEALYNQCLDIAPNHVECHRGLAVMLVESNRQDKAFNLLKNWANQNPNLSDPRIELSRLYQEFGQTKVAEQFLDEALAMDPNNARAWSSKGKMRESAGDLQLALQNYQQSLTINNLQPELYQRVAALNVRMASNSLNGTTSTNSGGTTITSQNSQPPRY